MTRHDHLLTLPRFVYDEAIGLIPILCMAEDAASLNDALSGGFVWEESPQGHAYWQGVVDTWGKKEQ